MNGGGFKLQEVEIRPVGGCFACEDAGCEPGLGLRVGGKPWIGEIRSGHQLGEFLGGDRLQIEISRLIDDEGNLIVQGRMHEVGCRARFQLRQVLDDPQAHDFGQAGPDRKALGIDHGHDADIPTGGKIRQQGELILPRIYENYRPFNNFRHDSPENSAVAGGPKCNPVSIYCIWYRRMPSYG